LYLSLTTVAASFHSLILGVFQDRGELAFLVGTVDIDLQRRTPNISSRQKTPTFSLDRILPANYNTGGLTYFDLNTLHSAIVHISGITHHHLSARNTLHV
jgi:hypothetical protein